MPKESVKDLRSEYQECFRIYEGVLEDLLRQSGVWSPNRSNDPIEMARNEGRRWIGLYVLTMVGEIKTSKEILCRK